MVQQGYGPIQCERFGVKNARAVQNVGEKETPLGEKEIPLGEKETHLAKKQILLAKKNASSENLFKDKVSEILLLWVISTGAMGRIRHPPIP